MKRVLFVTGTRADFGKLKPLIQVVSSSADFHCSIFVTGMHMMSWYGNTHLEIERSGFKNIFLYMNQSHGDRMEKVMANTIIGLSRYLDENPVDLLVVHGDRVEALAGATVGALRNILVAHVEGGEVSGTVDDLMRHAASKLSHVHFVASDVAAKRLIQLGEEPNSIFNIGSPDVDVMMSENLPSLEEARGHYEIRFNDYAIAILHPVTTEIDAQKVNAETFFRSLEKSGKNYVVIYPNNDLGSDRIFQVLATLKENEKFRIFPSLRFEYFLTLLKNAKFIVGNSSAGIHEAPVYGLPTIDVGTRQSNRHRCESIINVDFNEDAILKAIELASQSERFSASNHYGDGRSAAKFLEALQSDIWKIPNQKRFREISHV